MVLVRLNDNILTLYHDDVGHVGAKRTQKVMQSLQYWPRMEASFLMVSTVQEMWSGQAPHSFTRPLMGTLGAISLEVVLIDFMVFE